MKLFLILHTSLSCILILTRYVLKSFLLISFLFLTLYNIDELLTKNYWSLLVLLQNVLKLTVRILAHFATVPVVI